MMGRAPPGLRPVDTAGLRRHAAGPTSDGRSEVAGEHYRRHAISHVVVVAVPNDPHSAVDPVPSPRERFSAFKRQDQPLDLRVVGPADLVHEPHDSRQYKARQ